MNANSWICNNIASQLSVVPALQTKPTILRDTQLEIQNLKILKMNLKNKFRLLQKMLVPKAVTLSEIDSEVAKDPTPSSCHACGTKLQPSVSHPELSS